MGRWMARNILLVLAAVGTPVLLRGQSPPSSDQKPFALEVASIKPNTTRTGIRGHSFPGDRFEAKNVPLLDLILVAYGEPGQLLADVQVSGGPDWMYSERFDVSATVGSSRERSVAEKQLMLRTLLAERFKLAVHPETKELPIYALVLARTNGAIGPQLHHADVDCEPMRASEPGRRDRCILYALPSGKLMIRGQTMSALANVFAMLLDRVVKDRTGLVGGFDADAQFNPEGLPGMSQPRPDERPVSDDPSLDTALQEQLWSEARIDARSSRCSRHRPHRTPDA